MPNGGRMQSRRRMPRPYVRRNRLAVTVKTVLSLTELCNHLPNLSRRNFSPPLTRALRIGVGYVFLRHAGWLNACALMIHSLPTDLKCS